ncbi:MAG: hypothetical protein H6Q05_5107 [Acidobacteria bacterium]|nr:hypothetical protein [Acidobacteriota bacterium]
MTMRRRHIISSAVAVVIVAVLGSGTGGAPQKGKKDSRQAGEYGIYVAGKHIGTEKYVLASSEGSVTSSSTLDFSDPSDARKKVTVETKLEMDGQYLPRAYELKSDMDGQKGNIRGRFAPNQAIFEYSGSGKSQRQGLLVPERYTILDTNLFHHFLFLARLFKYGNTGAAQTFDVVIPQEKDTGALKISELQKETLLINGKKVDTTHLLVDSGTMRIQLWVDDNRVPRKIAVPEKGIEVVHKD